MIQFTSAQLEAWIVTLLFPLARVLAFFSVAPFFGNRGFPARVRLAAGLLVSLAILPALPPAPEISPGSGAGMLAFVTQMGIGLGMGFAMRIVFTAVDLAGELIGLQMGLGFATFYDPQSSGQLPVMAELLGLLALMLFIAGNGHLVMLATLADSFHSMPVGAAPLPGAFWSSIALWASRIFSSAVLMALPMIITLLITNLALGVLTRAAPQLNIFAVGFPLTLSVGFLLLMVTLPYLATPLQHLFEHGLEAMLALGRGAILSR